MIDERMIDERIEQAERLLLVRLALVSERTLHANVYVLTAGRHEWIPIEDLSVAAAAQLIRDVRDRERARAANHVSFEVGRSDWDGKYAGGGRDALLRDLGRALYEKGVAFTSPLAPAETQT
jgi:hypothetical protein